MAAPLSRWTAPRSAEYRGLALCAGLYAAALTAVVYFALPARDPVAALGAALDVGLAGLAWVTAEAIWRMRPWAYRAALALAVASVAVFALPGTFALLSGDIGGVAMLVVAAGIAFVTRPMVRFLKRGGSPVPVPRPRP